MEELLQLTRENNQMLQYLVRTIGTVADDQKDFTMNLIANLISNKLNDTRRNY